MKARALATALSLMLCGGQLSGAAERSPVNIVIGQVRDSVAESYQELVARQALLGSTLVPKKTVTWTFRGRSGKFLLAEVKGERSTSCVVYLLRGNSYMSLGGNDYCTWVKDPILVWNDNKAWLEFPQVIKQPIGVPTSTNEFTAHFSKATDDVCILGLPLSGYDALRCADDEAPDSK